MRFEIEVGGRLRQVALERRGSAFVATIDGVRTAVDAEPLAGGRRVVLEKGVLALLRWQRRPGYGDAEHRAHPRVLADTLMHHVLVRRAGTRLGTEGHPRIRHLRPDTQRLQPFGAIGLDQEVVA